MSKDLRRTEKKSPLLDVNVLYKEFLGLTNIERVGKEDFVLKELLKGRSANSINTQLASEHPDYVFSYTDFEKFLARNQAVVRAMGQEVNLSARRHLEAREQCSEMLAGLVMYTQGLVKDFRDEGDNTNTVAAIRALNTTLETYMKLEGHISPKTEGSNTVNIINAVSEGKSSLKDRIHNANFVDIKEE